MPCVLPQRITPQLCSMLKKYHPIYVNTHFNHPWEITDESKKACGMLADSGIPVGNQCVLMKDVNDNADTMKELMKGLLAMRVRPYYIYMADLTKGANHFRTPIKTGLEIMDKLRGHISGLAVPHFVIDAPGGGGKIPLLPSYVVSQDEDKIVLRNFEYNIYEYPDVKDNSQVTDQSLFMRKSPRRRKSLLTKKERIKKIKVPVLQNS